MKKNTSSYPTQDKRICNPKNKVKCFKCGKIDCHANRCYTKKKINEIEDKGLKRSLHKVMINNDISSEEDNPCHCTVNNCTTDKSNY